MAAENRETEDDLIKAFIRGKRAFSFFQVVHLIEKYFRDRARVGNKGPAISEVIRFSHDLSLAFPSADVESIEKSFISCLLNASTLYQKTLTATYLHILSLT